MIIVKYILITTIRVYQAVLSPLRSSPLVTLSGSCGLGCRFRPTCSQYTIDALGRYPLLHALKLSAKRISRCHPFYKGNYHDPIASARGETRPAGR